MNCPYCHYPDSRVIDSRDVNDGIRRRRQCLSCDSRFTTYERFQSTGLFVIKKDQRREEFDKNKLLTGLQAGNGLAGNLLKNEQLEREFLSTVNNLSLLSSNLNKFGLLWKPKVKPSNAGPSPANPRKPF